MNLARKDEKSKENQFGTIILIIWGKSYSSWKIAGFYMDRLPYFSFFLNYITIERPQFERCVKATHAWATFRSTMSGVKIHLKYDINNSLPEYLFITNANEHENNTLKKMNLSKDCTVTFMDCSDFLSPVHETPAAVRKTRQELYGFHFRIKSLHF